MPSIPIQTMQWNGIELKLKAKEIFITCTQPMTGDRRQTLTRICSLNAFLHSLFPLAQFILPSNIHDGWRKMYWDCEINFRFAWILCSAVFLLLTYAIVVHDEWRWFDSFLFSLLLLRHCCCHCCWPFICCSKCYIYKVFILYVFVSDFYFDFCNVDSRRRSMCVCVPCYMAW